MTLLSIKEITSNGDPAQDISFNFSYLNQSDIRVFVGGVEKTRPADWDFTDANTIDFVSHPPNGTAIRIERQTPNASRVVDFQDGSVLSESDLDNSADQIFFIAQEAVDKANSSIIKNSQNNWEGLGARLSNLADPVDPQDAATKASADHLCRSYYCSFNMPITILRPFNTYGPRQSTRAVIPTIINQVSKNQKQIKLGSISTTRDFNFVSDTVNAYIKCLSPSKKLNGETINIGSNFEISIKDIFKIVCKYYNRNPKIITEKKRLRPNKSEVRRLYSCNKKAKKILNWRPNFSGKKNFYKGIYKTCDWFEKNKKNSSYKSTEYTI